MANLGKMLITFGMILVFLGVALSLGGKLLGKIPWLGQLPGDIVVKRDTFTFYFPLATCLLASLVLSLVLYLFRR